MGRIKWDQRSWNMIDLDFGITLNLLQCGEEHVLERGKKSKLVKLVKLGPWQMIRIVLLLSFTGTK